VFYYVIQWFSDMRQPAAGSGQQAESVPMAPHH
jgi:hypothetical protein